MSRFTRDIQLHGDIMARKLIADYKFDKDVFNALKGFVSTKKIVKIGVLNSSEQRKQKEGEKKQIDAAYLASIHEFGATLKNGSTIPQRSFLRKTMSNYKDILKVYIMINKYEIIDTISKQGEDTFWNRLGALVVSYVHETFEKEGPGWPALSEWTIKARSKRGKRAKGNETPETYQILQETSQMKRSITHEVVG